MQDIKCKLSDFRIIKINIEACPSENEHSITLKVEDKLQCGKPKDPKDLTGMLTIETRILPQDGTSLKLEIVSHSFFSFDEQPRDFDQYMEEYCYPEARHKIQIAIKEITTLMGITPIDFLKAEGQ